MDSDANKSPDGILGLFLLIALILVACAWSWYKSFNPLHAPQRFVVMFHDAAGLISNSAVNVNGVRVGTVEQIELRGRREVLVHIKINAKEVVIPANSQFQIITNGIVGARYVEIELPEQTGLSVALNEKSMAVGIDPVRPEIIVNKVLTRLNDIDIDDFHRKIEHDLDCLTKASDGLVRLTDKFEPVAGKTLVLENKLSLLSEDFRATSRKMNRLIENPNLTADLKETATRAQATAQNLKDTMRTLNETLTNEPLRQDILAGLNNLNQSTENVRHSVDTFSQLSSDKQMRSDLKNILTQAREALSQTNELLDKPGFGGDLRYTLHDTRQAVQHMDLVAQQMSQILERRHPLVHMILGRPGHLPFRRSKNMSGPGTDLTRDEKASVTRPEEESHGRDAL